MEKIFQEFVFFLEEYTEEESYTAMKKDSDLERFRSESMELYQQIETLLPEEKQHLVDAFDVAKNAASDRSHIYTQQHTVLACIRLLRAMGLL